MLNNILRRTFVPKYLVKPELVKGDLPDTKTAYSSAFAIASPAIVETFLIAMMSMADTAMVGGVGASAIASVGLVTQPRFLALTFVFSLNAAVTSICARRKGEKNRDGAVACLKQSLILSAVFSSLVALLFLCFSSQLLMFSGAKADTIAQAKEYFDIILLGLPITAISLTISAAQRGCGYTKVSMYINMTANIVNLALNYLLIEGKFGFPRLEVKGAAIATVIGSACGLVLAIVSITNPSRYLHVLSRSGWRFSKDVIAPLYTVGSGSFGEQIFMRTGFFLYSMVVAYLGTAAFAAHQILINILNLSFSFGEGFGIAATTLVGQNLGAKRVDLSIMYGKVCQRMAFTLCLLLSLLTILLGTPLIKIFTSDAEIISICTPILWLMSAVIFGQSSQMIFSGCLRGAGDTRYTAKVSLISIVIIRPITAYILSHVLGLGLIGAWCSFFFDQYLRLFLSMKRFSSGNWSKIRL